MKKDTALALAIVAFSIACYAAIGAEWPAPPPGMAYETDLKPHSLVVTNVVLDDVATTADLADKRDKTDLTVYRKTVLSSDWSFVCHLADECQPVLVNGVEPSFYDVIFTPPRDEGDVGFCSMGIWGNVELGSGPPDGEIIFDPRNGLPTSARLPYTATFGGKAYKVGEWPRLKTTTHPTGDTLATTSTVAKIARSVVNTVWDPELGVAWEARMHNGQLYYVAVTNRPPEGK